MTTSIAPFVQANGDGNNGQCFTLFDLVIVALLASIITDMIYPIFNKKG